MLQLGFKNGDATIQVMAVAVTAVASRNCRRTSERATLLPAGSVTVLGYPFGQRKTGQPGEKVRLHDHPG